MANPATTLARTTQDKRIPELDVLPPGTNLSTLTVPVYNLATDKTHQAPIGGPVPNTNAVPGGAKVLQYRDSRLYGVPAGALTLDRLDPLTIAPGTLATVDNPADTPLTVTKPPKQYVATLVAAGTAGAVVVPRYIGATVGDTVPIAWQEVATGGGAAYTAGTGVDITGTVISSTRLEIAEAKGGSYTLQLSDAGKLVPVIGSGAATVTVPDNASVAFPVGTTLYVAQDGTGAVTIAAASGVVVQSADGYKVPGQWTDVALHKRDLNTWVLKGGVS